MPASPEYTNLIKDQLQSKDWIYLTSATNYLWYKVRFPPYALTRLPIIFSGRDQK